MQVRTLNGITVEVIPIKPLDGFKMLVYAQERLMIAKLVSHSTHVSFEEVKSLDVVDFVNSE